MIHAVDSLPRSQCRNMSVATRSIASIPGEPNRTEESCVLLHRNGTMPSKSIMREVFPDEMSEDSDEGLRRSSVSSSDFVYDVPNNETERERIERENKVSLPFQDRVPAFQFDCCFSCVSCTDAVLQEIRATGVTRDFRRAWEGDSSDTWEDSEDNRNLTEGAPRIKRRRIPGEKHSAK